LTLHVSVVENVKAETQQKVICYNPSKKASAYCWEANFHSWNICKRTKYWKGKNWISSYNFI